MSKIIGVTVGTPINPKKVFGQAYTFDGKKITLTVGEHINVGDAIEFIYLKGEGYSIDISYNDNSLNVRNVNAELSNAVIRETFIVPKNTSKCTFEGVYDVGQYVFLEKLVGVEKEVDELSGQISDLKENGTGGYATPCVFFTSTEILSLPNKDTEVMAEVEVRMKNKIIRGYASVKWQGSSSLSYNKKNYTVKFYKDSSGSEKMKLDVGWGEQNKYCFKANYIDTTHTRNISGARIAKDMVESRNESEFKTNLQKAPCNGAVDGFPIKLYINGEFHGIYTWNIPKDEWMFNMDKDNPNHLVLCAESNNNGVETNISSCEFRKAWSGVDGSEWSVEAGTLTTEMVNSFNRCIDFVMTATNEEFKNNISDYFDLDSLIDYYLFSYFVCHVDGLGKNLLMATYDGVHWGACLYDMDSIYGAYITGSLSVATDCPCPSGYKETNSLLWERLETCFTGELKNRYAELRKGALSLGNIVSHVEEIYDKISDRMLSDEKEKWSGLPESTTNTMTRFRNYMRDRVVYVDNCMNALESIPCTSISISDTTLSIVGETPQTLTVTVEPTNTTDIIKWESNNSSIATVSNGIVTPKGNGNCIITATCGDCSVSCNVNVSGLAEPIPCTKITLNVSELTFTDNNPQALIATVEPTNTTDSIVWESTGTSVASVNNGVVTPVGNGDCKIKAKCGEMVAECNVNVNINNDVLPDDAIELTEPTTVISMLSGYELNKNTGVVETKNDCCISEKYIKVNVGDSYTLSGVASNSYPRVFGFNYDSEYSLSNRILTGDDMAKATSVTFTIPSGVEFIRIQTYPIYANLTLTKN